MGLIRSLAFLFRSMAQSTFLTNLGGTVPVAQVAVGAQEQMAVFFATGGALTIDPDGADPLFEVPIVGALPEDLNFIP